MSMIPLALGSYKNVTSTTAITTVPTVLTGFYVNSTGGTGTLVFRDGGASGTVVTGTITPAIGWNFLPVSFATSLHVTIANTIDVTLIFNPTPVS